MSHRGTVRAALSRAALALLASACLGLAGPSAAGALTYPPGFGETTLYSGLRAPTDVAFAPNGRVFVAEKSGIVKTYENVSDATPTVFADLRTQVHNFSDRGLLSLVIDPDFPAQPFVYVFYVRDAPIGGTAPRWGSAGVTVDPCPDDTGAGCPVGGRISRLQASGEFMTGPETVLVEDFCEQFTTDTGGGLEFGVDGYLYMSAGDGAASHAWDYGQFGNPLNPCGDPPGGVGAALSPPTAEGGRLRSQDKRTAGDPLGLAGTLIRIDPATGLGVPGNPGFSSPDPNERRVLAYGLRNPYGLAIRPGTSDVWIADRGHGYWSELDRVPNPTDPVRNFGWPCYEGALDELGNPYPRIRPRSHDQNLSICENLYAEGTATTPPYWAYDHELPVVAGEDCRTNSQGAPINTSLSGLEFYPQDGGSFPAAYRGALFFSDRWRDCIWAMLPGDDGLPQRGRVVKFGQRSESPIDLEIGPSGDLFFVDSETETVKRVRFSPSASNGAPTASAVADRTTGNRPLTVRFDATGSTDPDTGDLLTYAWDLDGDGELDDSTEVRPTFTYTAGGTQTVTLRVTDTAGASDTDTVAIIVASAPVATIETPASGTTWMAGEEISFSGSATDADDGALPPAALDWTVVRRDCTESPCNERVLGTFENTDSARVSAPGEPAPAQIVVRLTATDSSGETHSTTLALDPQTVGIELGASPAGAGLVLNGTPQIAPFMRQVVAGSTITLAAPAQQVIDNTTHRFASWSDGQERDRSFVANAPVSLSASYAAVTPGTQTLTFPVQVDSYVDNSAPTSNFGTDAALRTDDSPVVQQSFLRFLVAGIAGHKVQSAKLRMRPTGNTIDGPAVFGTSNGWTETGITWENRPLASTGVIDDVGALTSGVFAEWDVTSLVQGDGPLSMLLASAVEDGTQFNSRDVPNVDRRPTLVVTVTDDAYARPKSASPLRTALVPAYQECTEPTHIHGGPLAHGSCNPPRQASANLTVGTPDANGNPANSAGSAAYGVRAGAPGTPEDEADAAFDLELSDVRNTGDLTDYMGELQARVSVRVTDRGSGPSEVEPATVQDVLLRANVQCVATAHEGVGGVCGLRTTLDALTPGLVREGARSVWQMGQIEVLDGGADGLAGTADNSVFARQGLFIP